jgi:hypothetical protein
MAHKLIFLGILPALLLLAEIRSFAVNVLHGRVVKTPLQAHRQLQLSGGI